MEQKFDLITIGDSTIDTIIKIHDAAVECDINHEECKICVAYGQKIPVDTIHHSVAGGAANVSVGSSRLGLKTAIYTNLGSDDQGQLICDTVTREGVLDDYIVIDKDKSSNLSVVLTFQGERTIFVYHQSWYYDLPQLANSEWLYFGSLAESFTDSNIVDQISHYVEKSGAKLVFAPGTYLLKADIKRFPRLLEKCYVLSVNFEEAKKIVGVDAGEKIDPDDLLSKMLLMGPKIVIITDGEEGSYASDGKQNLKAGIFPTKLVEKTGAGDAYISGVIAALHHNSDLATAMVWGSINASHVITQIGAIHGLLKKEDMQKHIAESGGFKAGAF